MLWDLIKKLLHPDDVIENVVTNKSGLKIKTWKLSVTEMSEIAILRPAEHRKVPWYLSFILYFILIFPIRENRPRNSLIRHERRVKIIDCSRLPNITVIAAII